MLFVCQCEKLRAEAAILPGIQAELDALRRRHSAALELMGERDEEVNTFLQFEGLQYFLIDRGHSIEVLLHPIS